MFMKDGYLSDELFLMHGHDITRRSTKAIDIYSPVRKINFSKRTDYLLLLYFIFDDNLSA